MREAGNYASFGARHSDSETESLKGDEDSYHGVSGAARRHEFSSNLQTRLLEGTEMEEDEDDLSDVDPRLDHPRTDHDEDSDSTAHLHSDLEMFQAPGTPYGNLPNGVAHRKHRGKCCGAYREMRGVFCLVFFCLCIISVSIAVICWFRYPDFSAEDCNLLYNSYDQRLNGTVYYSLRNPNFLSLRLEKMTVSVYYITGNTWYQIDDAKVYDRLGFSIDRRHTEAFQKNFSYAANNQRVASALLGQCFQGTMKIAFHGQSEYRFAGNKFYQSWGPSFIVSNCSVSGG